MTTLCFVFGRTQAAPSLFLCGFRKNRDFAGISLGAERFLGEEEQRQQAYECFLLGKHTVERVCSGLSPLRRDRLWC